MAKFIQKVDLFDAYAKFYPFLKPYQYIAILGILLTVPVGALDAAVAWFLKPFMDNVMIGKEQQFSTYSPFIIVGFTIIQGVFIYFSSWVNGYVGASITLDIRRKLYTKLLHMDVSYFDKNNSGMIIMRYFNDAEAASGGLIQNIKLFLTKFFSSISLICILFYNSWMLTFIALGVLVFLIIPMRIVRKKIKEIMTMTVEGNGSILSIYNETTGGNRIIKSFNLEQDMLKRFHKVSHFVFTLGMRLIKETNWLSPSMHIVTAIGVAIVIAVGGQMIVSGIITSGTFVSFLAALIMLYSPLKSIGNNYIEVQKSIVAIHRIYGILGTDTIEEKEATKALPDLPRFSKEIEFRNVNFSYVKDRPVLKNINFTVKSSQTVALVGNSGGGKSTICSLLPRLYEVNKGQILIDGINIKDVNLFSLRDQISYVFQDNFLFDTTLRENITLGNANATEEQITQALKDACLYDFVKKLPKGLDTQIGERGILLSGGQKQRLAIARAFVKDAPIVVLDEATSALDNKSEKVVQTALENLMQNRTVFIIAHRLSTIQNANTILVINDGEIVERGTHEELITKNGAYASLYNAKLAVESNDKAIKDNREQAEDIPEADDILKPTEKAASSAEMQDMKDIIRRNVRNSIR